MTDEGRLSLPIPNWLQIPDCLCSVGIEVCIDAHEGLSPAALALNDFEILWEYIVFSEMVDTARVEVAERRKDKICGNCRWPLCCGGSLCYGPASHEPGEGDRLKKSRVS